MNKFLLISILIFSGIACASSNMTYVLMLENNNNELSVNSLRLFDEEFSNFSNVNEGNYRVDILENKKVLCSVNFGFEFEVLHDPSPLCYDALTGEMTCEFQREFNIVNSTVINLPHSPGANILNFYHDNEFLFEYKIDNEFGPSFLEKYMWWLMGAGIILIILIYFRNK